jgi:hypothetical protein
MEFRSSILTLPDFELEDIHFLRFCLGGWPCQNCDTERHSFHSDQALWAIAKTWTAALGAAKTGSGGPVAPRFSLRRQGSKDDEQ